jgi:prolipoprotein diacylglyceryltransferase
MSAFKVLLSLFTVRFFMEFVKTQQQSYTFDLWLSVGQILSLPFIVAGAALILRAGKSVVYTPPSSKAC